MAIEGRIKIALAGAGAFGIKHLEALAVIDGAEVVSLVSPDLPAAHALAQKFGIPHVGADLDDSLASDEVDAVILCTPTPLHAVQGLACLKAGKHVLIEIPLADCLADVDALVKSQAETGLIAMGGHTRRFNPSHQWVHRRMMDGRFNLQQMNAQTYFFRRSNINALGQPRTWTDNLLWHHAAHTVDLFAWQAGSDVISAHVMSGPIHAGMGIAMDMTIQLKAANGAICTLSLSFNNDGPLGTVFRYIGDSGTYVASYDDLFDGQGAKVDLAGVAVSSNGIELQDREFLSAIREGRDPVASLARLLPCYQVLDALERQLQA